MKTLDDSRRGPRRAHGALGDTDGRSHHGGKTHRGMRPAELSEKHDEGQYGAGHAIVEEGSDGGRFDADASTHRADGAGHRGGHGRKGHGERREGGRRVLGRGELPLLILALLEATPRHGYELIRCIEDRCRGAYSPSAGVIYPTLTMLEEQALTSADPASETGKRRYAITDAGRAYTAANQGLIQGALARLDMVGRMRARDSLPARVAQAMETLKQALLAPAANWHDAEAERVAAVLERAALAIIEHPFTKEETSV